MARSRVELDPRFRRLMGRLPDEMTDPISRAIAESAEAVYLDAYKRVPVDTGDLRDSIGKRVTKTSATVGFDPKIFRKEWSVAGWRAKFVEFGTKGYAPQSRGGKFSYRRNGQNRTSAHGHVIPPRPPRPFMRPAFEANRRWIIERHREAVAATLRRAAAL